LDRLKEYKEDLFKTNEWPEEVIDLPDEKKPSILESKVRWALDQLPYDKA
jgi:hypothetical protein